MQFKELTTPQARAQLVAERLLEHRQQAGLTQRQAAGAAGISRDAVQRAERGLGTLDTFLRLLEVYGAADRLDLLLPAVEVGPAQRFAAAAPAPRRQRVRATKPQAGGSIWGDGQ